MNDQAVTMNGNNGERIDHLTHSRRLDVQSPSTEEIAVKIIRSIVQNEIECNPIETATDRSDAKI